MTLSNLAVSAVALISIAWNSCFAEGADHEAVFVELFTSEGCSSCPAAEALLGELRASPRVIAIAHHVDYWNSSRWQDRFALPMAARRQEGYVRALSLSSAFTPQLIVNGNESFVGSDRRRVIMALNQKLALPIGLTISPGLVKVTLPNTPSVRRAEISYAAYLDRAVTPIQGGENSGRTLEEFNIVRDFQNVDLWDGQAKTVLIKANALPANANRLAVIAQVPDEGPVLAAATIAIDAH